MADRVVLHVGAPKTGSTYLQQVLWDGRDELKRAGVLLPGTRAAHYQAMGDLRRGLWHEPTASWTWHRLVGEIASWPGTAVVSEEMLGAATRAQAARAVASLRPAEVHVVVTGRDLWRTIPSSWQQAVRARAVGRFGRYVAALRSGDNPAFWDHQTPLPILRRWGDQVPPERRHLVTVPPAGTAPDVLWSRFAAAAGIPDRIDLPAEPDRHNVSLGAAETELLRRINVAIGDRYPLRVPYLRVVRRHLVMPVLMRRERGDRFGAPAEIADWVVDTARRTVKGIREYPCRVHGDLDDLVPTDPRGSASPDELGDGELLDVALDTIVGLLGHIEDLVESGPAGPTGWRGRLRRSVLVRAARRLIRDPDRPTR